MSRDLVVYESVVGSCFDSKNFAYFHDWFDFILSSVIYVVSGFVPKFACTLETIK